MDTNLVSVIVPSFNKSEFIRETLDAVIAQEDVDLEVIVIDDASTDASWEIIADCQAEYPSQVTAVRFPENRGSTSARNHGARLARGQYLMFLDADDLIAPDTCAALRDALHGRSGCVAACRWRRLAREGSGWAVIPAGKPLLPADDDYVRAWLSGWYFPPCAILWPRDIYDRSGGWGEMGPWDDAEIMMRSLLRGTRIVVADRGEAYYRIYEEGNSLSSLDTEAAVRSRIRVLDRISREAEELGVLPRYREALARRYYHVARVRATAYPELVLECYAKVDHHLPRTPLGGSLPHWLAWRTLGLERKERLSRWLEHRGLVRRDRHHTPQRA